MACNTPIIIRSLTQHSDISYSDTENELIDDLPDDISSFKHESFESEEMKRLLKLDGEYTDREERSTHTISYDARNMFPAWILDDPEWKLTAGRNRDKISEVMQTPYNQRSQEQVSTLIHWLMTVWETANRMGFKRCGAMTKVFHYLKYEPGENVIKEGDRGLTFYIIISGSCVVHKENIGVVATIGKGQSFGEIALTEGKDLRTATVQAQSKVELLRLHKGDYDYFVKDIQLAERRENLHVLKSCPIFKSWSRMKIQHMVNTVIRKTFLPGEYIFKQGDVPDCVYVVVDGYISIIKEIHVAVRNRWPVGMHEWSTVTKKTVKPYCVCELKRGAQFGEQSVVKSKRRSATARARTKATVLCVDKLEFMHMLRDTPAMAEISNFVNSYADDSVILQSVAELKGGPSTTAQLNDYVISACDMSEIRPASPSISIVEETISSPCSPGGISSPSMSGGTGRGRRSSMFRIQADHGVGDGEHSSIPIFTPEIKKDGISFFSPATALAKSKGKMRNNSTTKKYHHKSDIGEGLASEDITRTSRNRNMFQFKRTTSSTERFLKQYNAALDATNMNNEKPLPVRCSIKRASVKSCDDGRLSTIKRGLSDTVSTARNVNESSEVIAGLSTSSKGLSGQYLPPQKRLVFANSFSPIKRTSEILPKVVTPSNLRTERPLQTPIKKKTIVPKSNRNPILHFSTKDRLPIV